MTVIERVIRHARAHGARIVVANNIPSAPSPSVESPLIHDSVYRMWIDEPNATIYACTRAMACENAPASLIHELAHLHATRRPVDNADEFRFIGWELALAKQLNVLRTWKRAMVDYLIYDDAREADDIGDLSWSSFRDFTKEQIGLAEARGIVTNGRPNWLQHRSEA